MATGEGETGPFRRGIASAFPRSTPHPARYSKEILPILRAWVEGCERVLDPLAGVGTGGVATHYNELELEWAAQCEGQVTVADARNLPYPDATFAAVVTSPVYGNRMSDHHEARDNSTRITYRHKLGRPLHPSNTGQLQWGSKYRNFHLDIWHEVWRVLEPGGRFILNVADHIRKEERRYVSSWHLDACKQVGFRYVKGRTVNTPGMKYGDNRTRVGYEYVYFLEKEE